MNRLSAAAYFFGICLSIGAICGAVARHCWLRADRAHGAPVGARAMKHAGKIAKGITVRTAKRLVTATVVVVLLIAGLMHPAPAHAAGDGRSQATPLPLNTPATIGDDLAGTYKIAVTGTVKDPMTWLDKPNLGTTEPAPAGKTYVIVQFKAEAINPKMEFPTVGLTYELVGSRHLGYSNLSNGCPGVIVPDSNSALMPRMSPGSTLTFNVCWTVPADEVTTLVLHAGSIVYPEKSAWFAVK